MSMVVFVVPPTVMRLLVPLMVVRCAVWYHTTLDTLTANPVGIPDSVQVVKAFTKPDVTFV